MKLRCTNNSIRIRIRRSEVDALMQKGHIMNAVAFAPDVQFSFSLRLGTDVDQLQAQWSDGRIDLIIPETLGQEWGQSNEVGLAARQPIGNGQMLDLLVEKDFPCMTRPDEDKSDFFGDLQEKDPTTC